MWNNVKTFLLLAALTALLLGAGQVLGGRTGLVLGLGLAIAMNLSGYWFSDKIALSMSGARPVEPHQAPWLHEAIEDLARAAGLPKPRVYVIPTPTPNAFATGRNPAHAAVAVTEGIMRTLDAEELHGVLAHEVAHIKNRDILISSVAAMLAGALTQLAQLAQFGALFGPRDEGEEGGSVLATVGLMIVAPLAASLVQMAVSRSREYEADRTAGLLTGRPEALARALQKLERGSELAPTAVSPATAHMYIVNPLTAGAVLASLFSTHPPTAERVRRLEALAASPEARRLR
ncbi:MAG: zinc metalloprotease HtpX [Candidatus Sericytochromatia bacterium]|nr:zinc metalloprotease HtpX [Candidatus Sericytochromatia bacterium]